MRKKGCRMKIGNFDLDNDVLVIAEIGNNHEGDFSQAQKMIELAAEAGVGAVKFQTYKTELFVKYKNKDRFDQLKSFELNYKQFEELSNIASQNGLIFLSTPLDLESAKFLNSIVPAFKIASGDNNFYPLLKLVASYSKPVILSSGIADLQQLKYSIEIMEKIWGPLNYKNNLSILHCIASYPVPLKEVNLSAIKYLKKSLDCTIGYSDHTIGTDAANLSVALGARIVEKHFTINKNYSSFRDHQLSADPAEMAQLVERIKTINQIMGKEQKVIQPCESETTHMIRRSIVANRNISAGEVINWNDITWMRPGDGIPPGDENLIIGYTLSKDLKKGDIITENYILK